MKLANGLHSEFSLYARDVLKIPKRKLPASVMQYRPKESSRHHHYRESASRPKCSTSIAMTELKKYYGLNANGIENGRLKGEDGGDVVKLDAAAAALRRGRLERREVCCGRPSALH